MSVWAEEILYNVTLKRVAVGLLESPLTIHNPAYQLFYRRQMKTVMEKYHNAPRQVMIENTNACNYTCSFCPHQKMRRKIGLMRFELYKKIIDECSEIGIAHVDIHQFGEPLLDRFFIDRIIYAKNRGIKTVLTNTNGVLLSEELAGDLIRSGLDLVVISIDAATQETYKIVRPSGHLGTVEKNVRNLVKMKRTVGSSRPTVVLDFLQTPENRDESGRFIKKWKGIADKICVSYMHDWASSVEVEGKVLDFHGHAYREPCRLLWTDLVISWDGRVPLCCIDFENEVILGNVENSSIWQVWHDGPMSKVRRAHLDAKFRDIPLCARCSYRSTWWAVW